LFKEVCGCGDGYTNSRSIDNHILTLRLKSENNPEQSEPLSNSASSGYKFTF